MDPMTIALLGSTALSGIGTLGGLNNARQQQQLAAAQNDLSFRNFYAQQRMAQQQLEMAQAGSTDARGNRTEYVPGRGWVTTPTAQTRALMQASDAEELARLTQDAPRSRIRRQNTFGRQLNEGAQADAVMSGMGEGAQSQDELRSAMIASGVARATSGADDLRRRIGLQNLRQGTGAERAIAALGRNARADTRTAIADARLNAPSEFVARRNGRIGGTINNYNVLASRATAPDDVPFQPTESGESLNALLRSRMNMAPQAIGSAMSVRAPTLQYGEDRTPVAYDSLGQYLRGVAVMGKNQNWWGNSTQDTNRSATGNRYPESTF